MRVASVGWILMLALPMALFACGEESPIEEAPPGKDAGTLHPDASNPDSSDATLSESGSPESGSPDGGSPDSGAPDTGSDASLDATVDAAGKGDSYNFAPPGRIVKPVAVFSSSGSVTDPTNVLAGNTTKLSGLGAQIVLDFGKEVGGVLSLDFAGASDANQSLGAAFTESSLYVGPNSDNSAGGGNSDGALAVPVTGPSSWTSARKYLRGGFRYLTLFLTSSGSVDLRGVSLEFSPDPERAIPNQYPNYFYSNDDVLNKAWYAGAYTYQTNIVRNNEGRIPPAPASNWDNTAKVGEAGNVVLCDGAKRDRTVWAGDMSISVPTGYAALNDTLAAKNALVTLFNHEHSDGHLQWSGPPWNLDNGSDTYHMWTMYGTYLGYLYSGDKAWLDTVWPKYKTALTYITNKIDTNGLLNVTSTADWGPRSDQGGENIEANSILYAVLQGTATLAQVEGEAATASSVAALATTLKAQVNALLWDSSVGAYKDNPTSTLHPQDGNSLAVWFGVIDDPTKAKGLSAVHKQNWNAIGSVTPEWGEISTFVGSMELMSHFVAGFDTRGLDMIRTTWGYMMSNKNGPQSTFWESVSRDGTFGANGNGPAPSASFTSLSHGWSSGPTSALTFFVLGVAPDTVLGQTYHVIPHPGDLTHVEGKLTFAPGKVAQVAYDVGAKCASFSMSVDASSHAGSTGTIAVPTFGANHTVMIDGAVAWNGTAFTSATGVAGASQDAAYIYFTGVQPGKRVFSYTDGTSCGPVVEEWTFCADENGSCAISGKKRVRYGMDGKYNYGIYDGSTGAVSCNSATFGGDPISGVFKSCQFSDQLFTACAAEGGTCAFTGTKEARFGANGQWKAITANGSTPCTAAAFGGDPLPNVVKSCEYR
jgi:hypothetical protein